MTQQTRVVVTGLGLVTPLGLSVGETWDRGIKGESGIGPLRRFDVSGYCCTSGAEVSDFELTDSLRFPKNLKFMGKSVQCAVRAAKEAVESSKILLSDLDPYRIGIYTGSGDTGLEYTDFFRAMSFVWTDEEHFDFSSLGGRASRLVDPYFSLRTLSNAGVAFLASEFAARGPSANFVQGDTASALAISSAFHDLLENRCDVAIVGGYDSLLNVSTYLAYEGVGLLSSSRPEEAYRPFDRNRDGIVLGEGAGFLVLESLGHAEQRGASILGEIVGLVCSTSVADATEPKGSEELARTAIGEAVGENKVDFTIAHGIGTPSGDRHEARILHSIFGDTVPITALKSQTGYLGAATAAVELTIGLLSAQSRLIPPVARLIEPESDFFLDLVAPQAREVDADCPTFLCLVWSWGGQFTALVSRAYQG